MTAEEPRMQDPAKPCKWLVHKYVETPAILAGGTHCDLLSHPCIGAGTGSERLTVDIHRYQKEGHSTTNVHPRFEQVYFVLDGEGVATVEGRDALVGPGSLVFIPRNAPHSIRNTGEGELVLAFISVVLD